MDQQATGSLFTPGSTGLAATLLPVIPPGPGPSVIVLGTAHETGQAGSWLQWGDVPTWALAVIALAALVAAVLAYLKQADAARKLAEQVDLQRDQLRDQQNANTKQAEVLDAQLREIRLRERLIERQHADAVNVTDSWWPGPVPGVRANPGPNVHMTLVENVWHRPIRDVVCRIQPAPGDLMHEACLSGLMVTALFGQGEILDHQESAKVDLVRGGDKAGFVFIYEQAQYPDAATTARFTDDAGLHWQIDPDLSLTKLDRRDGW